MERKFNLCLAPVDCGDQSTAGPYLELSVVDLLRLKLYKCEVSTSRLHFLLQLVFFLFVETSVKFFVVFLSPKSSVADRVRKIFGRVKS